MASKPLPTCASCGEEEALCMIPLCGYCMDAMDVPLTLHQAGGDGKEDETINREGAEGRP